MNHNRFQVVSNLVIYRPDLLHWVKMENVRKLKKNEVTKTPWAVPDIFPGAESESDVLLSTPSQVL